MTHRKYEMDDFLEKYNNELERQFDKHIENLCGLNQYRDTDYNNAISKIRHEYIWK
jgi:hypothetical protein